MDIIIDMVATHKRALMTGRELHTMSRKFLAEKTEYSDLKTAPRDHPDREAAL